MHNSRSSDRMQLQISSAKTEVIASNFIRPQTMIAVVCGIDQAADFRGVS